MPFFRESGILARYAPGDHPIGEVFGRTTSKGQFDPSGILQQVAIGARADSNYIGGVRTTLLEVARTNVAIQNRDLTQVSAWTASGITPLRNVVGIDGVANTATRLTATAPLGTILQSVTLASSQRAQSAYIQRITGSGAIAMTTDGGATWVTVTLAASGWGRCSIPAQTLANPQFGFRMATSGDVIAVDYVQNEGGQDPSSPIATTTIAVTRSGDTGTLPWNFAPRVLLTAYVKYVEQSTDTTNQRRFFRIGNSDNNSLILYRVGGLFRWRHHNGSAATEGTLAVAPAVGSIVEVRGVLLASGACYVAVSVNGAAETIGTTSGGIVFSTAWSFPIMEFPATGSSQLDAIIEMSIVRGERTMAEMRQIPVAAEKLALPRMSSPPRFPTGLQSYGQSGKGQFRSVQNMGRVWEEIYPLLDTANPMVRALLQKLNRGQREGIVWDIQHPYWHVRNGVGGGANILVQGASQTGNVLNIDGATPNTINWLREGDIIQVVGCAVIFDVTGDVNTDSSGFAGIPISPPIFVGKSPADNAWVEIDPAAIFFKAAIIGVNDYPSMDTTRFIDPGLTVTWREQPA